MRTIVLASQKGGSGKSTLAAHLSVAADGPRRPTLLLDTDPQGSLAFWHQLRPAERPLLARCEANELPELLEAAEREGLAFAFIDTPPHNAPAIADAMRVADLVLVPLRPAVFDIAAVARTLDMARALGKRSLAVINAAPPRRSDAESAVVSEAREALATMGAETWAGQITSRAGFAHALASGQAVGEFEPAKPAAVEIEALWRDVRAAVGKTTR